MRERWLGPKSNHSTNAAIAIEITAGTKTAATRSATARDARLARLRRLDHPHDLREHGVRADALGLHPERPGAVERGAHHRVAGLHLDRNRLAGEDRAIDGGVAVHDHAIHRDLLSGSHHQEIAGNHGVDRDVLDRRAAHPPRRARRQLHQASNRLRGAGARAGLESSPEQHQCDDHHRRVEIDREARDPRPGTLRARPWRPVNIRTPPACRSRSGDPCRRCGDGSPRHAPRMNVQPAHHCTGVASASWIALRRSGERLDSGEHHAEVAERHHREAEQHRQPEPALQSGNRRRALTALRASTSPAPLTGRASSPRGARTARTSASGSIGSSRRTRALAGEVDRGFSTPGTEPSASSTRDTQAAQCMPTIRSSNRAGTHGGLRLARALRDPQPGGGGERHALAARAPVKWAGCGGGHAFSCRKTDSTGEPGPGWRRAAEDQ